LQRAKTLTSLDSKVVMTNSTQEKKDAVAEAVAVEEAAVAAEVEHLQLVDRDKEEAKLLE
jgi:hypothetical protein